MKYIYLFILSTVIIPLKAQLTCGTTYQSGQEQEAYTLFCPSNNTTTYLIDNCGRVVHEWYSVYKPGAGIDFLSNGNLIRSCKYPNSYFNIAGQGGRIEILDWNSNIVWEYVVSDSNIVQHHDIEYLPNGNVIVLAIERKSPIECYNAGRDTVNLMNEGELFGEFLMELQPVGADSAVVVWEWHIWDHLVQDFNSSVSNYGVVAAHPELMDINYVKNQPKADWGHANSVFYNADLDQLAISFNSFNEFFIIDHSTTTAESASHAGGAMGKGGDILYRYGNPIAYDHVTTAGQQNEGQHTVHWIPNGYKDAGKILFFNNGNQRGYSTVDIVNPLKDVNGNYIIEADTTFGPDTAEWIYEAIPQSDLNSSIISGAQRLSNGNTLICEGRNGRFIEIDSLKNIVWEYINPMNANGPMTQGDSPTVGRAVFRSKKYESTFAGLIGKTLTPGNPLELNPDLSGCITTGIQEENEVELKVYPNPTNGELNILVPEKLIGDEIYIYNSFGQLIFTDEIKHTSFKISLEKSGVYFLKTKDFAKKVLKY